MSRFANPQATERLVLGDCECPGKPHDEDWIDMRTEFGAQDAVALASGNSLEALELIVVGWNLLDHDGSSAPVDRSHIERLFADTFDVINPWITKHARLGTLPNGSGAHSANGSRVSASATRTTRSCHCAAGGKRSSG
jgi:hypothetical protein